jgi:glycosyltransferase involved in cell wall biosynthesis
LKKFFLKSPSESIPSKIHKTRWLILSHGFNMDGRAASQIVTDKIPYFLEVGIKPIVFSAITGSKDERFPHKQFLAWGPAAFRFDFRHWISNRYGRNWFYRLSTTTVSLLLAPFIALEKLLIGFSNQWSWALPAFVYGLKEIRNGEVDLIYSSGGAWSAHLAAFWLKNKTGLTWIAEIHDPLVLRQNRYDQGIKNLKSRDAGFKYYLEQQICKHADFVWWFTDEALHFANARNPHLNEGKIARGLVVIPGAQPPKRNSLQGAGQHHYSHAKQLHLSHFGSLSNDRSLSTVLKAVIVLIKKYPEAQKYIIVNSFGSSLDHVSKFMIRHYSLEHLVKDHGRLEQDIISGKTGRELAIEAMQSADILILLHGNAEWCAEYIPSKFYEYLFIGKPIWAITNLNYQLDAMLQERGAYLSHSDNQENINFTLERIWLDWLKQKLIEPKYLPIGADQAANKILSLVNSI